MYFFSIRRNLDRTRIGDQLAALRTGGVEPRGSPRRSRTAKASRISRHAAKSGCAREWGGWGRLSDDGAANPSIAKWEGFAVEDPSVASALFWLSWMPTVRNIAAALVAAGVVMEFAEGWISEPWRKTVEDARTTQLAQLSTELEASRAAIAEASARQKEAELQLQQLRFPRSLDNEKFEAAVKATLVPTSYEVLYDANAPDASFLAGLIWGVFFNSKWPTQQTTGPTPLKAPPPNVLPWANMPWTFAAGGQAWGLSVVTNDPPDFEKNPLGNALVQALAQSVKGPPSQVSLGNQTIEPIPPGGVRIIVGPKLPVGTTQRITPIVPAYWQRHVTRRRAAWWRLGLSIVSAAR